MTNIILNKNLDFIFKDISSLGFWDSNHNYITEKIITDNKWQWKNVDSNSHRYGVFTLSMILLAKDLYNLDTSKHDQKIIIFILWIYTNLEKLTISELTYGALLSVILGKKLYNIESIKFDLIDQCLAKAYDNILPINDNQHTLVIIASKYFLDLKKNDAQLRNMETLTRIILDSINKSGYFETGDIRAIYHQRIMYTLWGLAFASAYIFKDEIKIITENILNFVWNNRRDKLDNAFIWHPAFYVIKNKHKIKVPVFNQKSAKYLFECHQTFFANSVNFYEFFFNSKNFKQEKISAMDWIWGKNRINKNLIEITGIDIPARIMDLKGNLFIKGQQFIGSYEIGSLILALASGDN